MSARDAVSQFSSLCKVRAGSNQAAHFAAFSADRGVFVAPGYPADALTHDGRMDPAAWTRLCREDPLLAAMLGGSDELAAKEPHPENRSARNRAEPVRTCKGQR
jgi:hypothetical protein